jgi:hypothetical protein
MCSSMNRRFAMMISPWRTAHARFLQRGRVLGPFGGGVDRNVQTRKLSRQPFRTRAAGPAAWLSSVTITTR